MAKTKRIKRKAQKPLSINSLYQTNRTGLIVGGFVVIIALILFSQSFFKGNKTKPTNTTAIPYPSISAPKDSSKTSATESAKPIVNTLPFTAGDTFTYTVKERDTLFSIGKVFCNSNAAFLELAERNNIYPPYTLHRGDTLEISCQ